MRDLDEVRGSEKGKRKISTFLFVAAAFQSTRSIWFVLSDIVLQCLDSFFPPL